MLPFKKDKLIFALCTKCCDEKCNNCTHNDEERSLLGTWTTDEVSKAVEKGYEIMEIYEVWNFKEKSNVKDFMKIKLETSPWENDFESIQDYISAIKNCLDIDLALKNISPNSGKCAVAKICLNSLWGKFGQRQNMTQMVYMTDVRQWYQISLNDKI